MKFLSRNRNTIITLFLIIILINLNLPIIKSYIILEILWYVVCGFAGYAASRSDMKRTNNET